MKRNVHIFTMVYGDDFIRRYMEFTLSSLFQSNNVPALLRDHNVRLYLYTTKNSSGPLERNLAEALRRRPDGTSMARLFKIMTIEVETGHGVQIHLDTDRQRLDFNRQFQNACLFKMIETAIEQDAVTIAIGADGFVGNGSLLNGVVESFERDICIAAPCLRVDLHRFRAALEVERWPIENDQLAAISLLSLLDIGRSMIRGGRRHLTYLLGTDIVPISPRLFSLSICFPSVFAARFRPSDIVYFKLHGDFRNWDATWPQKLIAERRFIFTGSSDMIFNVELMHDSPGGADSYMKLDDYFGKLVDASDFMRYGAHNEVMRNLAVTVRTDRDVFLQPF